ELSVKYIVMRGGRFNDIRGWDLDQETRAELRTKGVIKNYGTAGILLTAMADLSEILLVPDEEIGKMPIRESLQTSAIDERTEFTTGWLVWMELGQGITRPEIITKIKILP
ncbi:MAG: HK97-fold major capsid protein, partial [Armatimonadota bacterium]